MLYNMNKQHCKSSFSDHPVVKNLPANAGDTRHMGSIPWSRRSPGEGNANPLQCSCLENPRDGGAWWAAVYGVAQSRTHLKRLSSSSSSSMPFTKKNNYCFRRILIQFYAYECIFVCSSMHYIK